MEDSTSQAAKTAIAGASTLCGAEVRRLFLELNTAIAISRPLAESLEAILGAALRILDLQHGFVATLDESASTMVRRAERGLFVGAGARAWEPHSGVIGRVWDSAEAVLIEDYESWTGRGIDLQAIGAHALALVPIHAAGTVLGVIGVASDEDDREIGKSEIDMLESLAHLASIVFQGDRAGDEVRTQRLALDAAEARERRQRDQEQRILDLIPAAILVKDRENRIVTANRAAAESLGMPAEDIEGRYLWEIDPENAAQSYRFDLDVIESGEPLLEQLEERLDALGERQWCRVDRAPLLDLEGHVEAVIVLSRDVTEYHVTRGRLEESRRAAERANRLKSHMLSTLSREVRGGLEEIGAGIDRLLRTPLSNQSSREVRSLDTTAGSVIELVQDLLDFSRVEAATEPVQSVDLDLRDLVGDVLEVMSAGAHQRGLELASHVDPALPPLVRGDAQRLRQILVQILAPAIRAVDEGEVLLAVRTVMQSDRAWELRFEVRAGSWAPTPQELDRLLGPFLHGDEGLREESEGAAVGLALAHRLVTVLGGRVGVDRPADGGFECWCVLPFAAAETHGSDSWARPRKGARVLVVEPRAAIRQSLARQLTDLGQTVDSVSSTRRADEVIRAARGDGWRYDVCFVAADQPIGEGNAWIRERSHSASKTEKMVLMTRFAERVRATSADAILTKPMREIALARCLAAFVGSASSTAVVPPVEDRRRNAAVEALEVLVVQADPTQQRHTRSTLEGIGCCVEVRSDAAAALAAMEERSFALVLVETPDSDARGPHPAEIIRRADSPGGWRPVWALVEPGDRQGQERSLAAGVDGCLGRPPRAEELRAILEDTAASSDAMGAQVPRR